MSSILITGCSRGIGLEFVKQFLAHSTPPAILIATCRNPEGAKELQALAKSHKNLHILQFDVTDFDGLNQTVHKVEEIVGDKGLTVLLNNAGIHIPLQPDTLDSLNPTVLVDTYQTNLVAPLMITKAFRPLLRKAAEYNKSKPIGWTRAAVINVSSLLGSVASNDGAFEGFWAYRESKAALNMATRSLAGEFRKDNILAMVIHPGWVQTELGTSAAPLTVDESVKGMLRVLYSLGPDDQGCFLQWDGKVVPW